MRWEAEPDAHIRSLIDPLIGMLRAAPGGWPQTEEQDWAGWRVVKFGPQAFVFTLTDDGRDLYLKWLPPYFTSSRRRGLAIWPTPATKHVEWTRRLDSLAVDCAEVLAAGDTPRNMLSIRQPSSFVVTSSPVGTQTLAHYLFENDPTETVRRRYAESIRRIAEILSRDGICRPDVRPPNLLLDPDRETLRLFDFDSFCLEKSIAPWRRVRRRERDESKVAWTIRMVLGEEPMPHHWKAH